jgi:hypothetical protein
LFDASEVGWEEVLVPRAPFWLFRVRPVIYWLMDSLDLGLAPRIVEAKTLVGDAITWAGSLNVDTFILTFCSCVL